MKLVYIGCRTTRERNARGKGISVYQTDDSLKNWNRLQIVESLENPSWLGFDRTESFLYTVHGDKYQVSAFRIEPSGCLTYLNSVGSGGKNPVFLTVDKTNRFVYVASLQGGAVSVLKRREDGSLTEPVFTAYLEGIVWDGLSHAHQCLMDRTENYLLVPTQGRKKGYGAVFVFRIQEDGSLERLQRFDIGDDQEPRHLVFSQDNRFVYVLNEKGNTISTLEFDEERGRLKEKKRVSTLPPDYKGEGQAGEIVISPDGTYLYVTNRTHNSIEIFQREERGELRPVDWISSRGRIPRFMGLNETGTKLLAANEESDTVEVFDVDRETGALAYSGITVPTESPVCIIMKKG